MKVQNLAIIFLVITIPLIMILSYYLDLQRDTLELQAEYDTKLGDATKEGIKAFEVNTVDWSEWVSQRTNETARRNAMATINTFITSLSNNLNISGTAREFMENYIPAIAVTMYDGYYIYAPAYTPVTKENVDGVQLFYDETTGEVTTNTENGEILYEAKDGQGRSYIYRYTNEEGVTITETLSNLTTDVTKAKMDYLHTLNSKMFYSAHYTKNNLDVIVNYTLDNRISVYGENINKIGYLVYFDNSSVIPRAYTTTNDPRKEADIRVYTQVSDTIYNGTNVDSEILEEQILYYENGSYILDTFKYVYDIEHQKLYYDESESNFFTINSTSKERNFIDNSDSIKIGSEGCKYKSISILWGSNDSTVEYKKIYQALNGRDKGKWCISIKNENQVPEGETEIIDTEIKDLAKFGLDDPKFAEIYRDYSAISYYSEAYAFTNWAKQNLSGVKQVKYNEETKTNEIVPIEIGGTTVDIFNITQTNNPEDDNSPIVQHKNEVMKYNVETNLNLSISNYNRSGKYDFRLPVLSANDWEQVFSNISLITFFQGVPIGLKYYNNYAIATSTANREYVDPDEIYFSGNDANYHRVYCEKCGNQVYTGYRSVEYVMKEYVKEGIDNIYYYQHDNQTDTNSETACYYCVVNRENFVATTNSDIAYKQEKAYNEALARERYYQNERLEGKLGINIIYDSNMKEGGRISDVIDVNLAGPGEPATNVQEVAPGEEFTITDKIPEIITADGVKFVFKGWSLTADGAVAYNALDPAMFTTDTRLYAIWDLALDTLQWNKDYAWAKGDSNYAPNPAGRGNISVIRIYENSVEMYGNGTYSGKGAAWLNWQYHDINIVEMSFNYDIDFGDSFNAAGIIFNITDTNPEDEHSGELSGYMISFNETNAWGDSNNDGEKFRNAGTSTLWTFTYKKGKNTDNMEKLDKIKELNIPKIGKMTITIADTSYIIDVDSGRYVETIDIGEQVNVDKNAIGFFSDHYDHSCSDVGYFIIDNISIVARQNN